MWPPPKPPPCGLHQSRHRHRGLRHRRRRGLVHPWKKAAGKHCACQNHHHSSSHDILHSRWRTFRHRVGLDVDVPRQSKANVAMHWRWDLLSAVSIKFSFNHPDRIPGPHEPKAGAHQIDNQVSKRRKRRTLSQPRNLRPGGYRELEAVLLNDSRDDAQTNDNPTPVRCRTMETVISTLENWTATRMALFCAIRVFAQINRLGTRDPAIDDTG